MMLALATLSTASLLIFPRPLALLFLIGLAATIWKNWAARVVYLLIMAALASVLYHVVDANSARLIARAPLPGHFLESVALTLLLAIPAFSFGGMLLRFALTHPRAQIGALLAVLAVFLPLISLTPYMRAAKEVDVEAARLELGVDAYLTLKQAIAKRAELDPNYDIEAAIRAEAIPFYAEVLGVSPDNLEETRPLTEGLDQK